MSDPRILRSGEVLAGYPSNDHNAFYETWRKVNQLGSTAFRRPRGVFPDRITLTVFSEEVSLIDSDFPILKITGPVISPTDRASALHQAPACKGAKPTSTTADDEIVIMQGPIGPSPYGKGKGVKFGPTFVYVHWTDEDHTHCTVKADDATQLKSSSSGIKILAHEEIPDPEYLPATLWALVMLGGSGSTTLRRARVTTEITAATTAASAGWGTGEVVLCDDSTGEPTGAAVEVESQWPHAWPVDSMVTVNTSHDPPRIEGGTCAAEDAETFWGDE